MKEIRRDSITGDLVIYSSFRGKRPTDHRKNRDSVSEIPEHSPECPFCTGNEHMNGKPKGIIEKDGKWIVRSVANKFPILDMSVESVYGEHEVVIESNRHNAGYYNMSEEEFRYVFRLLIDRYREMSSVEGIKYVNIFKNSQKDAGASLTHSHSQIISLSIIPPEIIKELSVANKHYKACRRNLYDDIILSEMSYKNRIVHNGKYFLVYIPYATRYNGEIRIIDKTSEKVSDWKEKKIAEISYIYKRLFEKWSDYQGEIPFNSIIHTYSSEYESDYFRTHIHIIPRKYNFGGFELSTNLFVCSTSPDELADFLKF